MSGRAALLEGEVAGSAKEGVYQALSSKEEKEVEAEEGSEKDDEEKAGCEDEEELCYTIEEAVNRIGFGFFQVIVTFFTGLLWWNPIPAPDFPIIVVFSQHSISSRLQRLHVAMTANSIVADAMELMILSVLSPAVKCQWDLSTVEEAIITTIVFLGFLIGGLVWGVVCDRIGRKRGLFLVNIVIIVFGVLSAVPVSSARLPGYPWLLLCRFGVGLGAGGTNQGVTFYAEFLPKKRRGICLTLLELFWAIGSMFGALLALLVMEPLGWHWFLGLATIPLFLVLPMFLIVPESARYYIAKGQMEKAAAVVRKIAWYNCKRTPKGRLVTEEEKRRIVSEEEEEAEVESGAASGGEGEEAPKEVSGVHWTANGQTTGSTSSKHSTFEHDSDKRQLLDISTTMNSSVTIGPVAEKQAPSGKWKAFILPYYPLFVDKMWRTTSLLVTLWLGVAWLYYGIVLLTTTFLQNDPHCGLKPNYTNETCEESQLTQGDYVKILWTSAAELPGLLITLLIIEVIGRKFTMAFEFTACGIGFLLLFICTKLNVITFFLFLIRAFATGVFQAVIVYTPEVYPTGVRSVAMGVHSSFARIGAMITPFVAQSLLPHSDYATIGLYAGSSFGLGVLALLLPIETKGRALKET